MLNYFSFIGDNDCSYESVSNIFTYLNVMTCPIHKKVALTPTSHSVADSLN